ncbi:Verru_Chthon cassette protein A [Phragmitibacter flavus]|uniref:Verru_Chthon cassette protein A n=1 Tax=Phragmitibacter flavus TaxID=2576071 RepID=A0A5R8KI52_9BACT|nr:Verru_Chthon cassette protein A [Phragmitibacter flavus]TLD71911.1 Verru_Chthon cassette protein A [Phragmitibacter flavus]
MNTPEIGKPKRRRRGIALVTVISMLVILTVLAVAILSISDTERRSSVKYADGEFAKNLSDTAINVAMGQIWEGSRQEVGAGDATIWASQPGAIRKYSNNGAFLKGFKLYSDDMMVEVASEQNMTTDHPDTAWMQKPGKWVDLNEPVIRPDRNADGEAEVVFPIIDPRAFVRSERTTTGTSIPDSSNIEGFSYETRVNTTTVDWVVDATSVTDVNARLPMPVQWLYMLKDGTLGHVTEATGTGAYTFVGAGGVTATATNPIVGRIAFWTDDETSKLNINTAGEPTFWAPPISYHDRDYQWAVYQPTRFEYQRYPGHPATVALSTVLFPNKDMNSYGKTGTALSDILDRKERIYDIMPKINSGGSKGATVPFWALSDPKYDGTRMYRVDVSQSLNERLYASVDELLFSEQVAGAERLTQDSTPGAPVRLFGDHTIEARSLERMRFFLTAHSRAPETTIFGTPRVAMWPVANERTIGPMRGNAAEYRTVFDNLVAFCGTLQSSRGTENSYFFRRGDATSAVNDVRDIPRNQRLLNYLYGLMDRDFPSGGQAAASFTDKYRNGDAAQILTQIFDYIRCTNLYDGALAPSKDELIEPGSPYRMNGLSARQILDRRDQLLPQTKTYTSTRASNNLDLNYSDGGVTQPTLREQVSYTALPGHGQVVPIETTIGGHSSRGFGRFPTISEVGLHFICTADGSIDEGSWRIRNADGSKSTQDADISGGRTATKITNRGLPTNGAHAEPEMVPEPVPPAANPNATMIDRWYSNFPPYPAPSQYGTQAGVPVNDPRHYSKHPGYKPQNWNMTLTRNLPLSPGRKRVQAMLSFELTVPASGYPGIFPDMSISITGMTSFQIRGTAGFPVQLFNTPGLTTKRTWRAPASLFQGTTHNREAGGSVGPAALTQNRHVIRSGDMPDDPSYDASVSSSGKTYDGASNYDLVSNYFTIVGDTMQFTGGPITVNVYAGRDLSDENIVQTFEIRFPNAQLPTPELVVLSSPREEWTTGSQLNIQERIEAPRWWSFHYGGAIGRMAHNPASPWTGQLPNPGEPLVIPAANSSADLYTQAGVELGRTLGRFFTKGSGHGARRGIPRFDTITWAHTANGTVYPTDSSIQYGQFCAPLRSPAARTGGAGGSGYLNPNVQGPFGQDVVMSMVPKHGDIRLIAAKKFVPADDWELHPGVGKQKSYSINGTNETLPVYNAHSFMRYVSDYETGIDLNDFGLAPSTINYNRQLVYGARYRSSARPDLPATSLVDLARRYGDFDNGVPSLRDGAWINKPDEGNTGMDTKASTTGAGGLVRAPTAYYDEMWRGQESGESFMSPNRMVSSPGMFGSLSTGVKAGDPWRTLLFRPYVPPVLSGGGAAASHPGSPNYGGSGANTNTAHTPFKGINPADHYIMDLFWMPVVEPYAISEPFSTAGKVNINYQMVPFNSYIRRATGMHAVLKGEELQAFPTANATNIQVKPDGNQYVAFGNGYGQYYQQAKWSDLDARSTTAYYTHAAPKKRFWHRNIDIDSKAAGAFSANTSTLGQLDDRFNFSTALPAGARGLLRSASQVAELHLVPKKVEGTHPASSVNAAATPPASDGSDNMVGGNYSYRSMGLFWEARSLTGDNVRERPYANIYAKITTKSNTFRVHYRAQSIRKARSGEANEFNPNVDLVNSEYRGSALIERRIDPEDPRLPDYATAGNPPPLDDFYNFRVLENKRFAP